MDRSKHCLELSSWTSDQFLFFFKQISELKKSGFSSISKTLEGQHIALIFLESSTRTRVSFEKAAHHLGAKTILIEGHSSISKGETLEDTVRTLYAMGIEKFVIRSSQDDIFELAEIFPECSFINAGTSSSHHPTQGLLDAFTIWEHFNGLSDLKIVMMGDLSHSRVARSNLRWMRAMGIKPLITGPLEWIKSFEGSDVVIEEGVEQALENADVLMAHRVQKERFKQGESFDATEYFKQYGLTMDRLSRAKDSCIVMHPGPINRGIEIQTEVADHARSKIIEQVHNGVWARVKLLQMLEGQSS